MSPPWRHFTRKAHNLPRLWYYTHRQAAAMPSCRLAGWSVVKIMTNMTADSSCLPLAARICYTVTVPTGEIRWNEREGFASLFVVIRVYAYDVRRKCRKFSHRNSYAGDVPFWGAAFVSVFRFGHPTAFYECRSKDRALSFCKIVVGENDTRRGRTRFSDRGT